MQDAPRGKTPSNNSEKYWDPKTKHTLEDSQKNLISPEIA
jgi:hypothetical protein